MRDEYAKREQAAPYPGIGTWYRAPGGALFEVVAVDEDDSTIEVQHFDGTVEEFEMDAWLDAALEVAEAPEDWSGSLDIVREDYGVDLEQTRGESEGDFLGFVDRSR